ncbi:MAG: response regulator [Alphaproteobacteria bacterium HGW-Alphaproteobacteria-10]|jgi:CheY-like chemotaxis protein|nr:MAG: response regulator [Alphaproteobacteria bacterium HGW-Alphaproteobacteria-10]
MESNARRLVAIVDDDPSVLRALGRLVRSLGFDAETHASAEALLERVVAAPPDAVLLDLHLPGLRGPDAIHALRHRSTRARIIVVTGLDHPGAREACLAAGAAAYLAKPVGRDELAALLCAAEPERFL